MACYGSHSNLHVFKDLSPYVHGKRDSFWKTNPSIFQMYYKPLIANNKKTDQQKLIGHVNYHILLVLVLEEPSYIGGT